MKRNRVEANVSGCGELELELEEFEFDPPCPRLQHDALGVIFSFLSARELLRGKLTQVCKEWLRVLRDLAHAWGSSLDLSWVKGVPTSKPKLAWHCVRVSDRE